MHKPLPAVIVVAVVVGLLLAPAAGAANISNVQADDITMDISTTTSIEHDIQVTNSGENDTNADVTISNTPSGITVSHDGSETLSAGETTDVTLDIDAGSDPESGTVSGDVNGESFSFFLTVVPQAGFADEPLDLGDVLVDSTTDGSVTVEEITGDGSLDGVDIEVSSGSADGSLSFDDTGSVSGTSGTVDWEVTVDDQSTVDQYDTLEWTVQIADDRSPSVTREVDVEARVIYPGYFGDLDISDDEFVFDEPRDDGDTLTRTIDLEIPNDGDQSMEIDSVSASSGATDIDVDVSSAPSEIGARSTVEAALVVTASRDLPEGEYDLSASVDEPGFDGDDAEFDDGFTISHDTRFVADDAAIGDTAIGEASGQTVSVSEELGYTDVDNIETTLQDGPDDWLTLEDAPEAVSAGETETASVVLEFDTTAELGENYEWTYTLDGDSDSTTITVTASPVPLDLDPIRNDLSDVDGAVAVSTLELVNEMDDRLQRGASDDEEVSIVLTFGEAATLYVAAVDEADTQIDAGEHDDAQAAIIRAAAAFNTMGLQADRLDNDELRDLAVTAQGNAEADLDRLIDTQQAHYEEQLESGEISLIEEATVQRQLARIAVLQGDDERADELEREADDAFERYSESVSAGEQSVQAATDTWREMESTQFVTVLGQPLLVNPAHYDEFVSGTASIEASYDDAIAAFESAGETTRAEEVAAEQESRATALDIAQYSLFAALGVYALLIIGLITHIGRQMFWYIHDTRESTSGDFLV